MISFTYRGKDPLYERHTALVQPFNELFVKVQFDHHDTRPELMYNWHDFPAEDWWGDLRIHKSVFGQVTGAQYRVYNVVTEFTGPAMSLDSCYEVVHNCMKGQLPNWAPRNFIERTHGLLA